MSSRLSPSPRRLPAVRLPLLLRNASSSPCATSASVRRDASRCTCSSEPQRAEQQRASAASAAAGAAGAGAAVVAAGSRPPRRSRRCVSLLVSVVRPRSPGGGVRRERTRFHGASTPGCRAMHDDQSGTAHGTRRQRHGGPCGWIHRRVRVSGAGDERGINGRWQVTRLSPPATVVPRASTHTHTHTADPAVRRSSGVVIRIPNDACSVSRRSPPSPLCLPLAARSQSLSGRVPLSPRRPPPHRARPSTSAHTAAKAHEQHEHSEHSERKQRTAGRGQAAVHPTGRSATQRTFRAHAHRERSDIRATRHWAIA